MKIYVDEIPKSCYECEFCGKLKPPAKQPEIECMHCNLMKKLNIVSEFCPLHSTAELETETKALKEQLKNSITPKFSLKQKVWFILRDGKDRDVFSGTITLITLSSYYKPPKLVYTILLVDNDINLAEDELFATREEAQKRLAELEGK